ncbi:MAG: radical SAM protein, partial [Deltaproteobacteria bacterium]|nr:radical SAM protein [Deltaproteobacteria bacterium]
MNINKNPMSGLDYFIEKFGASLSPESIIKEDILRQGISFDDVQREDNFSSKSYFIFSFNVDNDSDVINKKYPEEISVKNGPYNLKRTIISVRINKTSPYSVKFEPDSKEYKLYLGNNFMGDVFFSPEKSYMLKKTDKFKSVRDVAPTIEWGYLIYLAVFRMCQYFENHTECAFCDMNSNYLNQKKANKNYSAVKSVEDIISALSIIESSEDSEAGAYTLTGGSIIDEIKFKGDTEIDFYVRFLEAIEDKFRGKWLSKVVVQ